MHSNQKPDAASWTAAICRDREASSWETSRSSRTCTSRSRWACNSCRELASLRGSRDMSSNQASIREFYRVLTLLQKHSAPHFAMTHNDTFPTSRLANTIAHALIASRKFTHATTPNEQLCGNINTSLTWVAPVVLVLELHRQVLSESINGRPAAAHLLLHALGHSEYIIFCFLQQRFQSLIHWTDAALSLLASGARIFGFNDETHAAQAIRPTLVRHTPRLLSRTSIALPESLVTSLLPEELAFWVVQASNNPSESRLIHLRKLQDDISACISTSFLTCECVIG